jgi:hypothetical protein
MRDSLDWRRRVDVGVFYHTEHTHRSDFGDVRAAYIKYQFGVVLLPVACR